MELLEAITTRASAARLIPPGPSRSELERILLAASKAPDHGRLRPWRLIVLEGELRERFAQAAAEAKRTRVPTLTDEQVRAQRMKLLASPTLLVVACAVTKPHKIPEIEQVIATGAATENLFLAAHSLGFGVMWKTGAAAYDGKVKSVLGLAPEDHIVGIMHLGTRPADKSARGAMPT